MKHAEPIPTVLHYCQICGRETDCEKIRWKARHIITVWSV